MRLFSTIGSFISVTLILAAPCRAEFWNLPLQVSDQYVDVRFNLDSSLQGISGRSSGVSGQIWLENPQDFGSIKGQISFPVSRIDTGNSWRDEKLKLLLALSQNSEVVLNINSVSGICAPAKVDRGSSCNGFLIGRVDAGNLSRNIRLPYNLRRQAQGYFVSGETDISWGATGISDPTRLLEKLAAQVRVNYQISLPD